MADPMTEALDGIEVFIADADQQFPRWREAAPSLLEAVEALRRTRKARQCLAGLEALLERQVTQAVAANGAVVVGPYQIKVHGGFDRKDWDSRTVARRVVSPLVADETTGEVFLYPDQVWALLDRLLGAATMYWKVTALRELGVDFDGLCKEEPKRRTVQFLSAPESE